MIVLRANEQWDRFHDYVDDIVYLAVRHISHEQSDVEPHEDVTKVEKYKAQDLRKMQLEDETTAQIIRWLEDDHKPSQAELALYLSLQSSTFGCFDVNWLCCRMWFIIRGLNNKQAAIKTEMEGSWWPRNHCR